VATPTDAVVAVPRLEAPPADDDCVTPDRARDRGNAPCTPPGHQDR
jgi:hypothetical protein